MGIKTRVIICDEMVALSVLPNNLSFYYLSVLRHG